jgi:hypothetical protein
LQCVREPFFKELPGLFRPSICLISSISSLVASGGTMSKTGSPVIRVREKTIMETPITQIMA